MITNFTTGPAYDPVVNTMSTFATVSSAKLVVKGFSPLVAHPMLDAEETGINNRDFTIGAKMDVCAIARSSGEATIV